MKSTIQGNVTRSLELLKSASGAVYTRIPMAVDSIDDFGRKQPTFLDVTVFGERAEALVANLQVGDFIQLDVRITNRTIEHKDGSKSYSYNFVCQGEVVRLKAKEAPKVETSKEAPKKSKRSKKAA